ncbi:hypothetical protein VFPPC_04605 [Pochonia chlamydosporia 170]|uniref:2EXR domain-containing protein n=1 Tax=Pochonia chlamydosporia 170 TaxID=1380566 RepID=A0A179FTM3_METCM|nr:hypothetical protein VFPPC_04605 [Pochonia chlamydosporia 170]OAQ68369.1 hypothetical protein VFPPC_04605 [Pochonia chlamydosporia 170]
MSVSNPANHLTTSQATNTTTIAWFPSLPTEIRLAIWRLCIPRCFRPINHDLICGQQSNQSRTIPGLCGPPLIAKVCREARQVALEHGKYYDNKNEQNSSKIWIDKSLDTVYLNGAFDPRLSRDASHALSVAANATQVAISMPWLRGHPGFMLHKGFLRNNHLRCTIACEDQFDVSMSYAEAIQIGIFGLWAEERFAFVDPSDDATLAKLSKFELDHGFTRCADGLLTAKGDQIRPLEEYASPPRIRAIYEAVEDCWLECLVIEHKDDEGNWDISPLFVTDDDVWMGFKREHPWVKETLKTLPEIRVVLGFQLFITD